MRDCVLKVIVAVFCDRHDSLNSQSLKINPFSKKLSITFLITAIGYFCLYLLFVLFRIFDVGLGINPDPVEVTALVLLSGILVALSVFYIVTGIRILKRIAKSTKLVGQSKKRTKTVRRTHPFFSDHTKTFENKNCFLNSWILCILLTNAL